MNYRVAMLQMPLVKESAGEAVRTPYEVYRVCSDLADLAQEAFHVLLLNAKNRMTDRVMVSLGLLDASLVHPREVFRAAITENAAALILVHNHPSGDPCPSAEDIRITRQLVEAGRILQRREVARRFNRSLRFVDKLAVEGILPRVKMPERIRACGYREEDVERLMAGEGVL